jgi:hypothetical protein
MTTPNASTNGSTTSAPLLLFSDPTEILKSDDITFEDVPTPEWGAGRGLRIYALTGTERDEFEDSIVELKKELGKNGKVKVTRETVLRGARGKLVSVAARKEDGSRLFTPEQAIALGDKAAKPLQRCFEVALRLAGMTEDEVERLGNDSTSAPSDGSTSASL